MITIKAKSQGSSVHFLDGYVTGGEPGVSPGDIVPFDSIEQAREHLTRNGWEIIEEYPNGKKS